MLSKSPMCSLFIVAANSLFATVSVSLSTPPSPSQLIGTRVSWTASNAANDGKTLQFRWVVTQFGATVAYRDFHPRAAFSWAPTQDGIYTVSVSARDAANLFDQSTVSTDYVASSPVQNGVPALVATVNPLVAIYSAPCSSGNMRVFFAPSGTPVSSGSATPYRTCVAGRNASFVIAGMRASSTYSVAHQIAQGFSFTFGPTLQFTTSAVPAGLPIPGATASNVAPSLQPVILNSVIGGSGSLPVAYDRSGALIWYNYPGLNQAANQLMRPMNGGTMIMAQGDLLDEIDLLGNVVRETNIQRMGEQLSAPPFNVLSPSIGNRIADFNHEAIRLPNGYTATLSIVEQIANQGDGAVDVLGDLILVLDQEFQLKWVWNPFTKLNLLRKATMNDKCASFEVGCPRLELVPPGVQANDWTHANALAYTGDGHMILSLRDQDWILKVNYANGAGSGDVLWRFGNGGDFSLAGGYWFSHQHYGTLTGTVLSLFDNANANPGASNGSRGLLFSVDENAKTASIISEARMNNYSPVVGSAQRLLNGNYYFLSGFPNGSSSNAIEFAPTPGLATQTGRFDFTSPTYRSFQMKDLYTP